MGIWCLALIRLSQPFTVVGWDLVLVASDMGSGIHLIHTYGVEGTRSGDAEIFETRHDDIGPSWNKAMRGDGG
jgi:hypothetical protein